MTDIDRIEHAIEQIETGDAWDVKDEVVDLVVHKPLDKVIPVRLASDRWERLRAEAKALGTGPSTLARMWLLETLRTLEPSLENRWRVRVKRTGGSWEGPLHAVWEVARDPISDSYTPDELAADILLEKWAAEVSARYPNGLIPIYWFVESRDAAKFEAMPFQFEHSDGVRTGDETFLSHYNWPEHAVTGQPLNWLSLPVVDKHWNARAAQKGGFIQEATGWKPSILQPFVNLPALLNTSRRVARAM